MSGLSDFYLIFYAEVAQFRLMDLEFNLFDIICYKIFRHRQTTGRQGCFVSAMRLNRL
ncbi:Uncharacterized protein dnm_047860 [Desulfonema magnum]|uniref:Uncharacterized protein n=1 Tax=Desulfonema magnum TaxID=45655 RepID=A0A975GPE0_9BACT|nr:Uncharacterized protein dnm_047860 [Desulfonema magnum]